MSFGRIRIYFTGNTQAILPLCGFENGEFKTTAVYPSNEPMVQRLQHLDQSQDPTCGLFY